MVTTRWKRYIERAGRAQRSLAQALSVNQAELSMVVQGRAFLTPEKFNKACELLGCRPTEVYGDDVLELMYGRAQEPKRKRGLRVELEPKQQEFVENMAEREGVSKSKMVNGVLEYVMNRRELWP